MEIQLVPETAQGVSIWVIIITLVVFFPLNGLFQLLGLDKKRSLVDDLFGSILLYSLGALMVAVVCLIVSVFANGAVLLGVELALLVLGVIPTAVIFLGEVKSHTNNCAQSTQQRRA